MAHASGDATASLGATDGSTDGATDGVALMGAAPGLVQAASRIASMPAMATPVVLRMGWISEGERGRARVYPPMSYMSGRSSRQAIRRCAARNAPKRRREEVRRRFGVGRPLGREEGHTLAIG